tara:strand:- start:1694 stop:4078 length:2385 start_codon:yes stop_codon:yes gene_type:complete
MATFEATRGQRVQHHFEVLEIDLPVINGTCTIGSSNGFGTPLTCDQPWVAGTYKTYKFTNCNAPVLAGEYWRCISAISENVTELKPSKGLSSRGSLAITFQDFTKQDPNPTASGVTDAVKLQGTFFGKLAARQIFENKPVRLKLYRVEADGTIDLVNGAETRHYVGNTLSLSNNGTWKLECKDVLSIANLDDKSWPIPENNDGVVRLDTDQSATKIPVDAIIDYAALVPTGGVFYIRIGDEFLKVESVEDNQGPAAKLVIANRGSNIVAPISGELLTRTEKDDHKAGDEIFICEVSDNETIDNLITRILIDSDVSTTLIPATEWAAEVAEWHLNDKINTLHSESESVNKALNRILTGFLMDLWFSTTENLIKLSAISVWKQSSSTLTEGKEINAYSIKKTSNNDLRATRALILYDKQNLADSDDTASYKKASQFSENTLIGDELYVKHKDKLFDNNHLLGKDAADILVQRYVSRFKFTPFTRSFTGDERYLNYKTGDVVDLVTTIDQGFDGLASLNIRGQILKIKPKYSKDGRTYDIKAMTYEPAFNNESQQVITDPSSEYNLYTRGGNPSQPTEMTFVFDGSYSYGSNAINAGSWPAGSKIIIILANGFDGQSQGGAGGNSSTGGGAGGIVYDAQGVDTDIYFSGATPSTDYPTANGYIRAAGGGGGGGGDYDTGSIYFNGGGGGGGAGRAGGIGGESTGPAASADAQDGFNGDIIGNGGAGGAGSSGSGDGGNGGDWGVAGSPSQASSTHPAENGGAAGSGIIDGLNAAGVAPTVNLFGATAARYINGNGDH